MAKYEPRLAKTYKLVAKDLAKELNVTNVMATPKLVKIVVNIGQGDAVQNVKTLEAAAVDLARITGQKPILTKAKKSIATFKLREGQPIGCCVTLRKERMYEFLDRFINITVPRIRDFRGFSPNAFDGRGNYSVGIKEQIVFPEIDYDKVDKLRGLSISIVTSADTDIKARALLEKFNFPFRK